MQTIIVPPEASGLRLDKFLLPLAGKLSRAEVQRDIKSGRVSVNEKVVTPHFFLKGGERIMLHDAPEVNLKNLQAIAELRITPQVVAATADYLVLNKPSGVVVHAAPNLREATLADWLIKTYPELMEVGDDPLRPGIVHRLDREVSGLMVVARTQVTFESLKRQFQARQVKKTYLGLVVGIMQNQSGTINFPLARSRRNTGKMAARVHADEDTRDAITHYEVIRQYQQVAFLRISLETGRTHQIRAHLSAIGHPLVGDNLYRPRDLHFKKTPGRIFLHSHELAFSDSTNMLKHFTCALPEELNRFLDALR